MWQVVSDTVNPQSDCDLQVDAKDSRLLVHEAITESFVNRLHRQ